MARLTKIELEQRLDAALKDAEQLRVLLAVAEGNVRAYREHGNKLEDELAALRAQPARKVVPSVERRPMTPWREAAQKARALAMSTGRSVLVG